MKHDIDFIGMKAKLYQGYKSFNKFADLSDEDIERIKKEVSYFDDLSPIEKYIALLQKYTKTSPRIHRSFDEKIAGMIEGCDPHLITLRAYVMLGRPDVNDKDAMKKYEEIVREKIGIFDANLRPFEAAYNNHVLYKKDDKVKKLVRTKKESE